MLNFIQQSRARAADASSALRDVRPRVTAGAAGAALSEVGHLLQRAGGIAQVNLPFSLIERNLEVEGGVYPSDFLGTTPDEARELWSSLSQAPLPFVEAFLKLCSNHSVRKVEPLGRPRAEPGDEAASQGPQAQQATAPSPGPASTARGSPAAGAATEGRAALRLCAAARAAGQVPAPDVLADAILVLAKAGEDMFTRPVRLPAQEVSLRGPGRIDVEAMAEQAVWLEFCGWKASARGYSSAVRLYGRMASHCASAPWPPTPALVDAYVTLFRSAGTLARYISHLRTVLLWLRCPLGPLADTARVVRGAEKAGRAFRRPRVRATASETRALAKWCSRFGFADVGASWVVARHFCLRYGEVLQIGSSAAPVSIVAGEGARKEVVITYVHRKC